MTVSSFPLNLPSLPDLVLVVQIDAFLIFVGAFGVVFIIPT